MPNILHEYGTNKSRKKSTDKWKAEKEGRNCSNKVRNE
jgi:hypothetical protein